MTTYTLSDLRRAFLAAYNEAYSQGAKKWAYREQEAWDDYAKVLQVEEPEFEEFNPKTHTMNPETLIALEDGRTVPFRVLLQAFNSLELERYEEANYGSNRPYNFDEPTDEPVPKALVEEVQKMLDDCQKNWKAATEASIESAVNRIAGAFLEVSEVDYGIGVKTMFRKMAEILEGKA